MQHQRSSLTSHRGRRRLAASHTHKSRCSDAMSSVSSKQKVAHRRPSLSVHDAVSMRRRGTSDCGSDYPIERVNVVDMLVWSMSASRNNTRAHFICCSCIVPTGGRMMRARARVLRVMVLRDKRDEDRGRRKAEAWLHAKTLFGCRIEPRANICARACVCFLTRTAADAGAV